MGVEWTGTVVVLRVERVLNAGRSCKGDAPLAVARVEAVLAGALAPSEGGADEGFAVRWGVDENEAHWSVRGGVDYVCWLTEPCEEPAPGERWIACVREGAWEPPAPSDAPGVAPLAVTSVPPGLRALVAAPDPRERWSEALEQRVREALGRA